MCNTKTGVVTYKQPNPGIISLHVCICLVLRVFYLGNDFWLLVVIAVLVKVWLYWHVLLGVVTMYCRHISGIKMASALMARIPQFSIQHCVVVVLTSATFSFFQKPRSIIFTITGSYPIKNH